MVLITFIIILGCISFSSETINRAKSQAKDEVTLDIPADKDQDTEYTKEQQKAIKDIRTGTEHRRRNKKAYSSVLRLWDHGRVPYTISNDGGKNKFSDRDRRIILEAINEWESFTCLRFVQANDIEPSITFASLHAMCASGIGKSVVHGSPVYLGTHCRSKGTILHEIGHALGFIHAHNRPDRDKYIRIHFENIKPWAKDTSFYKASSTIINTYGIPFDFESIMHYGKYYFTRNGKMTITALRESDTKKIGNRFGLTYHDIHWANLMYNCSKSCSSQIYCRHGFLGKDCRCWCKGPSKEKPVVYCDNGVPIAFIYSEPMLPIKTPPPSELTDSSPQCKAWAEAGFCTHELYVMKNCKKTCYHYPRPRPRPRSINTDMDQNQHCVYLSLKGHCYKSSGYMLKHCKRTCGLRVKDCADMIPKMCQTPMYRRECNFDRLERTMRKFCSKTCNYCAREKQRLPICEDFAPRNCRRFANRGECYSEDREVRKIMQTVCRKSCGLCYTPPKGAIWMNN